MRIALTLALFAAVFITLTVSSYRRESATWDEPQHLTAGYTALTRGDYRVDIEHPPLSRLWSALPLLISPGARPADRLIPQDWGEQWLLLDQFGYCHDWLYRANDADRLLYRARFMVVLFGVLLGVLVFCWARELLGYWPAVGALALYCWEPNLLAHSRLVTTDFGITLFLFSAVYFLWRTAQRVSWPNLAGLVGSIALAAATKFTAVLLGPIAVGLLAVRVIAGGPWGRARTIFQRTRLALGIVIVTGLVVWATIWAVYGFRYAAGAGNTPTLRVDEALTVQESLPALARVISFSEQHHLLPNAYTQGFLLGQVKAQQRAAYLAGEYRLDGWWYFFPFAMLIKTPVGLLLLVGAGLAVAVARARESWRDSLFILVPILVVVGAGMVARLNIGLRHVLPAYPFLILLAASAIAAAIRHQRAAWAAGLVGLAILECALVYPHVLAFFNWTVGGPRHGAAYLVDSNIDWGQDLKGLKRWMDSHQVDHINLSYFGTADPAYYGIRCTHLPGAPHFAEAEVRPPVLPGYVAVSVTNLRGVYLGEGRDQYKPLLDREPVARIGYSIYVYDFR